MGNAFSMGNTFNMGNAFSMEINSQLPERGTQWILFSLTRIKRELNLNGLFGTLSLWTPLQKRGFHVYIGGLPGQAL